MKPLPPKVNERDAPLTFAWKTSEGNGLRLCLATVLAAAVFGVGWAGLRIVVPSSISGDGPLSRGAQYVVVGEDADPSLLRLLEANEVPSLAVEEFVGEAPFIDDLLSQLGLVVPAARARNLYPAPLVEPELAWPQVESAGLTLPQLPVVAARGAPVVGEAVVWMVRLVPKGQLAEHREAGEYAWTLAAVTERQREFFVTLDQDGRTVAAALLGEEEPAMEAELRRLWERQPAERPVPRKGVSGVVGVEFFPKRRR